MLRPIFIKKWAGSRRFKIFEGINFCRLVKKTQQLLKLICGKINSLKVCICLWKFSQFSHYLTTFCKLLHLFHLNARELASWRTKVYCYHNSLKIYSNHRSLRVQIFTFEGWHWSFRVPLGDGSTVFYPTLHKPYTLIERSHITSKTGFTTEDWHIQLGCVSYVQYLLP